MTKHRTKHFSGVLDVGSAASVHGGPGGFSSSLDPGGMLSEEWPDPRSTVQQLPVGAPRDARGGASEPGADHPVDGAADSSAETPDGDRGAVPGVRRLLDRTTQAPLPAAFVSTADVPVEKLAPARIPGARPTGTIPRRFETNGGTGDFASEPVGRAPGRALGASLGVEGPDADDDGLPRAGEQIRHYELIRELGRGGMGVVYLARDTKLARRVAIKFLRVINPRRLQRFFVEAKATARCEHENIVVIHDVDQHGDAPYMVLEYLRGQTLRDRLDAGRLSPESAVELMIPVLRALVQAHSHEIVHRDLKPCNVFITDSGRVKVLDFGIAKLLPSYVEGGEDSGAIAIPQPTPRKPSNRVEGLLGTLPYMSPEQLRGFGIDHRSDIWAVGLMLYEMVLGQHPLEPLSRTRLYLLAQDDEPIASAAERLPEIGPLGAIIDRCLLLNKWDRTTSAEVLLEELEGFLASHRSVARERVENPFTGLAAFQENDAERFFGRSRESEHIVAQLADSPVVTVIGPSGSGKSSLVRAGAIPRLKRSGEGWHAVIVRPGRHPFTALANGLMRSAVQTSDMVTGSERSTGPSDTSPAEHAAATASDPDCERDVLATRLGEEPGFLGAQLRRWARRKRRPVVLVVDQLEELFTVCGDPDVRSGFIRCLEGAADDPASPVRVVLTIRSDFLDRLARYRGFMNELSRGVMFLAPMDREHLYRALTAPVEAAGHTFESRELIATILDQLQATSGALPLLQFAASKLWQARDVEGRRLTWEGYRAMGGIAGALVNHADAVLGAMTPRQLVLVRAIFERLVTPERTRAIATLREVRELPGNSRDIEAVVHHLADSRLLTVEESEQATSATVEIIHESLIESWPTLGRWLDENQDDVAFLARLRTACQQWERSGHADGALWRGELAEDALRWRERYYAELPGREQAYLDAVRALAERKARRRRHGLIGTIALLSVLLVVAVSALLLIRSAEGAAGRSAEELVERERELEDAVARWMRENRAARAALAEAERARADAREAEKQAVQAKQEMKEERDRARHLLREAERMRAEAELARLEAEKSELRRRLQRVEARGAARRERKARRQSERLRQRSVGRLKDSL